MLTHPRPHPMDTLTRIVSVRDRIRAWRAGGKKVALVPTAGNLHKGHASLIAAAQKRADYVIVSLFANPPTAEAPTLEADRELLQKAGADLVFAPPVQEIYPVGHENAAVVNIPYFAEILEGAFRPGHFAGMSTLLAKLFNILRPDFAVFGERDYQQLVIVRRLVDDLFVPVEIIPCATCRESDGLAVAAANRRLTVEHRAVAPQLFATLGQFAHKLAAGERDTEAMQRHGMETLTAAGFVPEYFAIRQAADLAPVRAGTRDLVLLAAARLGATRLIDNLRVRVGDRL